MTFFVSSLASFFVFFISVSSLQAAHGISIDGNLKYPADFKQFDYVSKDAAKGGKLSLHDIGSFDKMNPFTLKGTAPFGLDMFVFEPLAEGSFDEPFAEYGLIAKDIELAEDRMSVTFTVNEEARFSDGTPVTPEDVRFSLETLKSDRVHPFYPYYYHDIKEAKVLDTHRVQFLFNRPNRELHMIAASIPVLSQAFYKKHPFTGEGSEIMVAPVGSGPYVVSQVTQGKSITYKKNPNYWARNHPVRKGMYNFDTITVNYYKDQVVAVEAFKAGEFDFMMVNIAKQWARDMVGKRFDTGELIKKSYPHQNNAGMQGFLMNSRRPIFQDVRVRQAMGLAFDFQWTNKSLFYGQYARTTSFFSNSYLAATGLPSGLELTYLEPFRDKLPHEVFTTPLASPDSTDKGGLRSNLRKAQQLLEDAGWTIQEGVLRNSEGKKFHFEILLVSPFFERVMAPYVRNLKKLGMEVDYRTIDPALYTDRLQNFDFDMTVHVYGQSQSPGNEQKNYWHSESADRPGSKNLAGIKDPVVDAIVEKIIYAQTQEELTAACKALDRVLWYGYYLVPNWYLNVHRIAYRNSFLQPDILPLYYNHFQLLMTWWSKESLKK
ncbi:MAG: extracellular solute-binding protein [Proteobacteria bacterium]|nr:extracellular solute-binding protein [Pseudomonadota bacterium]MBU1417068.1 extracellular solute-binding protein [Pseudomonadota bacterium]MBU1453764.1 extracellular solute-binding protein [Pseudomonadota bacterium]